MRSTFYAVSTAGIAKRPPVDAVVLREHYELADYDRDSYIAEKQDLLVYPEPNQFRVNILGNTERTNK